MCVCVCFFFAAVVFIISHSFVVCVSHRPLSARIFCRIHITFNEKWHRSCIGGPSLMHAQCVVCSLVWCVRFSCSKEYQCFSVFVPHNRSSLTLYRSAPVLRSSIGAHDDLRPHHERSLSLFLSCTLRIRYICAGALGFSSILLCRRRCTAERINERRRRRKQKPTCAD